MAQKTQESGQEAVKKAARKRPRSGRDAIVGAIVNRHFPGGAYILQNNYSREGLKRRVKGHESRQIMSVILWPRTFAKSPILW
jgi:hypothetical protein